MTDLDLDGIPGPGLEEYAEKATEREQMFPDFWNDECVRALAPTLVYDGPCATPRQPGEAVRGDWETSFVYLFLGGGQLLYVGMTRNPWGRFSKHACKAMWWKAADRVLIFRVTGATKHVARRNALRLEWLAIQELSPLHNIAGVS